MCNCDGNVGVSFSVTRIDAHFLIKITDFGMSEDVCVRNYFMQGSAEESVKLPVKWMAPESLTDGQFSEKSDMVCGYFLTLDILHSGEVAVNSTVLQIQFFHFLCEGFTVVKME